MQERAKLSRKNPFKFFYVVGKAIKFAQIFIKILEQGLLNKRG
jgi:hypothetical protein